MHMRPLSCNLNNQHATVDAADDDKEDVNEHYDADVNASMDVQGCTDSL